MGTDLIRKLRRLEGRNVHLCLADGSRLDDVSLVSVRSRTIWVFGNGADAFVRVDQVTDFWEASPLSSAA